MFPVTSLTLLFFIVCTWITYNILFYTRRVHIFYFLPFFLGISTAYQITVFRLFVKNLEPLILPTMLGSLLIGNRFLHLLSKKFQLDLNSTDFVSQVIAVVVANISITLILLYLNH